MATKTLPQSKSKELVFEILALEKILKRLKTNYLSKQDDDGIYDEAEIVKACRETREQLWKEKYEKKIKALSR